MSTTAPSSGLPETTLAALRAVLAAHPNVEAALLYGSRALGRHKKGSDIDLALSGVALTERELAVIGNEIDDLLLPYTLDLCLLAAIDNPALLAHIHDNGKAIFTRPGNL